MTKLICFSLWGNNPKYTIGAIRNAKLAAQIYPDWVCRFYCGQSVPKDIIYTLKSYKNCEVMIIPEEGNWTGMFWRFYPMSEEGAGVMISRDCDSRLSKREKLAVDEWLNSDKGFHIMRDHNYHGTEILGGMFGCKNGVINDVRGLIENYVKGNFWQVDQNFLREKIYPIVKNNSMIHDEFFEYNNDKQNFPSERKNYEFVGDSFDENDNRHPEYWRILKEYLDKK